MVHQSAHYRSTRASRGCVYAHACIATFVGQPGNMCECGPLVCEWRLTPVLIYVFRLQSDASVTLGHAVTIFTLRTSVDALFSPVFDDLKSWKFFLETKNIYPATNDKFVRFCVHIRVST